MNKLTGWLLLGGILLCLLQVWLPTYYLTGDGPSHLYNAQILHDLWVHQNTSFYDTFYKIVYQPNPNWLTTVVLTLLLFVVKGVVAEKIFLTLYILLFTRGFYLLLKKISVHPYWALVLLLFVFPHVLAKGFYNFSFSIAFYFWMVWSWLRFLEARNIKTGLLFFLFTGLIFFTHLLSFVFGAITCASLVLSYTVANMQAKQKSGYFFIRYSVWLASFLLPFVVLAKWFTQKEGGMQLQLKPHLYRLIELIDFKYLVSVTSSEDLFATITGLVLLLLAGLSFFYRPAERRIHKYDGFILALVAALVVYLLFPEAFLGRLILISMRVQPFVFILLACCIAYRFPKGAISRRAAIVMTVVFVSAGVIYILKLQSFSSSAALVARMRVSGLAFGMGLLAILGCIALKWRFEKMKAIGVALLYGCFVCLGITRLVCQVDAANAAEDYLSAGKYIMRGKVVLPLDGAPSGKDAQGRMIADENYLFVHTAQYMSVQKPLIILDNYEANMGYFPINWQERTNPYTYLSKAEGIEGVPPFADIADYKRTTGVSVDYVLLWCYDPAFLQNEHFRKLYSAVQADYHVSYVSPSGRTILYEANRVGQ